MVDITLKRVQMLLCAISLDYGKKALNSLELSKKNCMNDDYFHHMNDYWQFCAFQSLTELLYRISTDKKIFSQYAREFIL